MADSAGTAPSTDPESLYERLAAGERVSILDLRDRDEFEAWHIDGPAVDAVQVPHVKFLQAEVTDAVPELVADLDLAEPVVAVCARGEASSYVADLLRDAGIEASNLADGMNGWARVVVARDLTPAVRQYYRPSSGCLAYLVHDGGEGVVVDPLRAFADRYVADAGVELTRAVDTHVHADHLSGVRAVAERTGATPVLPEGARDRGLAFDATLVGDGETVDVGDTSLTALHAPGHTTEMTAFRVGGVLLSGDSLFLESVARPDLEAGDDGAPALARRLHETLHERLLALPEDTLVAPGHVGPAVEPDDDGRFVARLGELRERLDLLGLGREAFVGRVLDDVPPRPANYGTIIDANLGRAEPDDDEAFELELGPNNCAVSS